MQETPSAVIDADTEKRQQPQAAEQPVKREGGFRVIPGELGLLYPVPVF